MSVDSAGRIEAELPKADKLAAAIVHAATEDGGELQTAQLASAVGTDPDDGTFKRARQQAENSGTLVKVRRGVYRAAEQGLAV